MACTQHPAGTQRTLVVLAATRSSRSGKAMSCPTGAAGTASPGVTALGVYAMQTGGSLHEGFNLKILAMTRM